MYITAYSQNASMLFCGIIYYVDFFYYFRNVQKFAFINY